MYKILHFLQVIKNKTLTTNTKNKITNWNVINKIKWPIKSRNKCTKSNLKKSKTPKLLTAAFYIFVISLIPVREDGRAQQWTNPWGSNEERPSSTSLLSAVAGSLKPTRRPRPAERRRRCSESFVGHLFAFVSGWVSRVVIYNECCHEWMGGGGEGWARWDAPLGKERRHEPQSWWNTVPVGTDLFILWSVQFVSLIDLFFYSFRKSSDFAQGCCNGFFKGGSWNTHTHTKRSPRCFWRNN